MPVLNAGGDFDDGSRCHFYGIFAPFLIPASSADADQNLTAPGFRVVNMPVVFASRFKGDVGNRKRSAGNGSQPAAAVKILRIGVVWLSNREEDGLRVSIQCGIIAGIPGFGFVVPDRFGVVEYGPGYRLAGIEAALGNQRGNFFFGYAVFFRKAEMVIQRSVAETASHEDGDDDHAACFGRKGRVVSDLSKENVIVIAGKVRCKFAQGLAARSLYNFSHDKVLS